MPYDFGGNDDYLKQNMPYDLDETRWKDLQQKIKEKVLAQEMPVVAQQKKRFIIRPRVWVPAAAGLALLLTLSIWIKGKQDITTLSGRYQPDAEQQLDRALNSMNEHELDWIQLSNEPSADEEYEYQ